MRLVFDLFCDIYIADAQVLIHKNYVSVNTFVYN